MVKALKIIFKYKKDDKIIGTRHGEKLYESLLSREEMARVINDDKFYKIPPDDRGLNYDKYFFEGKNINNLSEYTSHNANRLSVDQIIVKLSNLEFVKEALND